MSDMAEVVLAATFGIIVGLIVVFGVGWEIHHVTTAFHEVAHICHNDPRLCK